MLEVNIDYLKFGEGDNILNDIEFKIEKGEVLLISGMSESGKTSLCQSIAGIIPIYNEGEINGSILLEGREFKLERLSQIAGKIAYISDNPQNQLFSITVEEDLSFGPSSLGLSRQEIKSKVRDALKFVGLEDYEDRSIHTLSGGEAQRAVLGSFLTLNPSVIILDEAFSQLDPEGKKEIYQKLKKKVKEENKILIIVDKDTSVFSYADHLLYLENGRITYSGPPRKESLNINDSIIERCGLKERFIETTEIIKVEDLSFQYGNGGFGLKDISLTVNQGEFVAIIGENGAGKTTLVKHFNSLHRPTKGQVVINGKNTRDYTTALLSADVGYLFQNPQLQICTNSVAEEVGLALKFRAFSKAYIREKVDSILEVFKLNSFADDHPYTLSKGQLQKLALASVVIAEPKVLIIDEPTSQMDIVQSNEIMNFLESYRKKGATIIMISHDIKLALNYASRLIIMKDGEVIQDERIASFSGGNLNYSSA